MLTLLLAACGSQHNFPATRILQSIPLELTTHLGDQQTFTEGDEIQFLLSLGDDAYIYMYYVDAENQITQLLPNKNQSGNFYTAGYFLTIPEYSTAYRFKISQPFGKESLWVFASDQEVKMNGSFDSIDQYRRLVKQGSNVKFGQYELQIITVKKY